MVPKVPEVPETIAVQGFLIPLPIPHLPQRSEVPASEGPIPRLLVWHRLDRPPVLVHPLELLLQHLGERLAALREWRERIHRARRVDHLEALPVHVAAF